MLLSFELKDIIIIIIYDPVNHYAMVIYTELLYISVPGIILSIKPKTIAYMTQLTSLNTCVLHHGYIYRISVCFSFKYNS